MKKQLTLVFTATLLMAAVLVVMQRQQAEQEESAGTEAAGKSGRSGSSLGDRGGEFESLLKYRSGKFERAPSFDELDAMARHLSDAELLELVEGKTFLSPGTMETWVKCAAYTELGRRDPENTLNRILAGLEKQEVWLMDNPILFSIFRGWAEVDPLAAAQRLVMTDAVPKRDGNVVTGLQMRPRWKGEVYREIFAELARREGREAVGALSLVGVRPYLGRAWDGIFRATGRPAEVRELFVEWEGRNEFNTSEVSWRLHGGELLLGGVDGNREDRVLSAALSIAESDLAAGSEFLARNSPIGSRGSSLPHRVLLEEYGRRHPEEALAMLRSGESDHLKSIALGAARSNLANLPAVMEALVDRVPPAVFLSALVVGQGQLTYQDQLPRPGQGNRLANGEERFAHLRAAIQHASLTPEEESQLLEQLERESEESMRTAEAGGQ